MFHQRNISAHALFVAADVPADGFFNTGTFQHGEFSAQGIFGTQNFQHLNISAQGYFGAWIFRHMDISAPCKAIWTFRQWHFGTCGNVPKCPCAEMSSCRNVPPPPPQYLADQLTHGGLYTYMERELVAIFLKSEIKREYSRTILTTSENWLLSKIWMVWLKNWARHAHFKLEV